MAVSRVQKYKDYRNSLIKEETPVLETPKSSPKTESKPSQKVATSTLPMDEVIETLQEEDSEAVFLRKRKIRKVLFIAGITCGALLLIGGIVVFGILVWR